MTTHRISSKLCLWLTWHAVACCVLMTLSFAVFGVLPLDLVKLVSANAGFLWRAGRDGLMDGGFAQLLERVASAAAAIAIAIAIYIVLKRCEHVLVDRLVHK